MIPYTLIQCTINDLDVRITDCSIYHLEFRVPEKIDTIHKIQVSFYIGKTYESISLQNYTVEQMEQGEFFTTYRVEIEQEKYANHVRALMQRMQDYISLKLEDQQEKITRYPVELDEIYPESKKDLLQSMFFDLCPDSKYKEILKEKKIGICLENPTLVDQFLKLEWSAFQSYYFEQACLQNHPIRDVKIEYIYIGNSFCEHLFPNNDTLSKVIEKCRSLHLICVVVFSPMKEHNIQRYKSILNILDSYSEVVINDLGMLELLKESTFNVTLGVLLNKHLKDTRMQYVDLNLEHFIQNENSYNYKLSYESCGYALEHKAGSDLYFPKYQTNTASMCTMYAKCHNGNRAYQQDVFECPRYCASQHFLYPKHLNTIGEYNSIFGYDLRSLQESDYLEKISENAERMIVSV